MNWIGAIIGGFMKVGSGERQESGRESGISKL